MTIHHMRKSILCPSCRKLISRDETSCPYCGTRKPSSWLKNNYFVASLSDPDQLIRLIIYTNVGMYILSLMLNPRSAGIAASPFDFLSPSNWSLSVLGSTGTQIIFRFHRYWTLISANYLHGSLLHILFNMLALRQLGPLVFQEYGGSRMFAIYTLGGIAGFYLSALTGIHSTIGASASVCSLIGAILYFGKSRGGVYGEAIYSQIGGWAVGIFIFGFMVPGINNWAHGGGMAAGAILGYFLGYQERFREKSGHSLLGLICLTITAMVLSWACLRAVLIILLR